MTYDKHNGTVYTENIGHSNEISAIAIDNHNKMIIST